MVDVAPMLLTPAAAAEALQIEPETLEKLRNRRDIGYVRVGCQVRYRMVDLTQFIEANAKPCRSRAKGSRGSTALPAVIDGTYFDFVTFHSPRILNIL